MLREPQGMYPYNNTIDLSNSDFSFIFTGDKLYKTQVKIFDASNGVLKYTNNKILNIDKITDDEVFIPIEQGSLNGKNLMWSVKQWENNSIYKFGNAIVSSIDTTTKTISFNESVSFPTIPINISDSSLITIIINGMINTVETFSTNSITYGIDFIDGVNIGDSIIFYSNYIDSNKNLLANTIVANTYVYAKPEDTLEEKGYEYPAISSTNFYIQKHAGLEAKVASGLEVTPNKTYYIYFVQSTGEPLSETSFSIVKYDYESGRIVVVNTTNDIPPIGLNYIITTDSTAPFSNSLFSGSTQIKPTDVEGATAVTYPSIDNTHIYIGRLSKIPTFASITNGDYYQIIINNIKNRIIAYNQDSGYCTLRDALLEIPTVGTSCQIKSNLLNSSEYFFKSRSQPTLEITNLTNNQILNSRDYGFLGYFEQTEDEEIKYFNWKIYDRTTNGLVYETEDIFDSSLYLYFNRFINNKQYKILLSVYTQNEVSISTFKDFSISYDENVLRLPLNIETDKNNNSILINCPQNQYSNPKTNMSFAEVFKSDGIFAIDDNGATLSTEGVLFNNNNSYLNYDSVSDQEINFQSNNFYLSTSLNIDTSVEGEIIKLSNDENNYVEIKKDGNKILLNKKENGLVTEIQILEIFTDVAGGTSVNGISLNNEWYYWDDATIWNDNLYWIENKNNTNVNTYKIQISGYSEQEIDYIKVDIFNVRKSESLLNVTIPFNSTVFNNIFFKNKIGMSYLVLVDSFNNDFILTDLPTLENLDYKPKWEDYQNTIPLILCTYNSEKIKFSSSSTEYISEIIKGYLIFRCVTNEVGDILKEEYITTVSLETPSDDAMTDILKIRDYTPNNNTYYKYKLYPLTSDKVIAYMTSNNFVKTNWEYWTFTEVKYVDIDKRYTVVGNPWQFKLNSNAGAITINTGRAIHENLSQFPTTTIGKQKYLSQTFTSLIGNFNNFETEKTINGDILKPIEYKDDIEKIDKWIDFVNSPNPILVSSPKGIQYLATISSPNISIDDKTVQRLTTVSFTLTQIGSAYETPVMSIEKEGGLE